MKSLQFQFQKYAFKNFYILTKIKLANFSKLNSSHSNPLIFKNKFSFCSLERLNVDKISMNKLNDKDKPIELNLDKKEEKPFSKEDYIVEYTQEVKWEDVVLNSEIPVVVDCYAV
jgi:hypothetical protein